jgi:hypothetical protein
MMECTRADFDKVRECATRGWSNALLAYTDPVYRPDWMTDEQWRQFVAWNRGEAVPTNQEIIEALRDCRG